MCPFRLGPKVVTKKERSRAYPLVDLQVANELLRTKLTALGEASVDRDDLAKTLGYSSAQGGVAARKIGALVQYGLLTRQSKLYRMSRLGRQLLSLKAGSPDFKSALQVALEGPMLFRQLLERYRPEGRLP